MIEYELVRSKRKTLAVQVTREGRVIVRAPLRLAKYRIERFVADHTDWIARALADQQSRRAAHPEPDEAKQAELIRRAKIELSPKVQHYAKLMNLYPTGLEDHLSENTVRLVQRQKQYLLLMAADGLSRTRYRLCGGA